MLALCAAAAAPGPWAWAQGEPVRSLVAHIDFESEIATGQQIPRGWIKSELPGITLPPDVRFPKHYLQGALTEQDPHGGAVCFGMGLNGGNIAYTFSPGLPAFADSDYLLTGYVRTKGLKAARAQARLFMVDALGQVLAPTMTVTEPMGESGGEADGQWQPFQIRLKGTSPETARLQITLSLVQPELWRERSELHIYQQDIDGSAFWDDLRIYRLPRVRISTDVPGNVFPPGTPAHLRITVQGVEQVDSGVMLTIRDAAGIIRLQQVVNGRGPQWRGDQWVLPLAKLEPGRYEAELMVSTSEGALTRQMCRFICLAEVPGVVQRSGLGLYLTGVPMEQLPTALVLASHMRAGSIKLSAWLGHGEVKAELPEPRLAAARGSDDAMLAVLTKAHAMGMTPELVLDRLPADIMGGPDTSHSLLESLASPPPPLEEAMLLMLARYGLQVGSWQIGPPFSEQVLWDEEAPKAYQTVSKWMRRILDHQKVLLSWSADFDYELKVPARLSLAVGSACQPQELPDILGNFRGRIGDVFLEMPRASTRRMERLSDLALRYAYIRCGGADRIFMPPPWRVLEDGTVEPDELLMVGRTLAGWLGDAECTGVARLSDSTVAVIFRKGNEGRMIVHSQADGKEEPQIRLSLPPGAFAVDLWGRRRELTHVEGQVVLPVDGPPLIIVGCDADALALRASLRVAPQVLNSRFDRQSAAISFVNPYGQPVTGTVRLTAPEGWTVQPRIMRFSLEPGQEWSCPLAVWFPYRETTGLKKMDVRVEVEAREGRFIEAPAYFYLTPRDVEFDVFNALQPNGDMEVRASIVNRAGEPISYECFAQVPNRARQSTLVHQLAPGARAEKVFRFPRGTELYGKVLRTGLVESEGRGVVNRTDVIR